MAPATAPALVEVPARGYREQVDAFRRHVLLEAIRIHGGNHSRAAKGLGLQRNYFLKLLAKHDIPRGPLPSMLRRHGAELGR